MMRPTWRLLRTCIARPRLAIAALTVASLAAAAIEAGLLVAIVRSALSLANDERATENLDLPLVDVTISITTLLILSLGAVAVMLGLHYAQTRLTASMAASVLQKLRHDTIDAYANASWAAQERTREGTIQEHASSVALRSSQLALIYGQAVSAGLALIALLAVATAVSPAITSVVVVLGAGVFLALRPLARATRRRATRFQRQNTSYAEMVGAFVAMSLPLKAFGVETVAALGVHDRNREVSAAFLRSRSLTRFGQMLYRDFALALLVLGVLVLRATDSPAALEVGAVLFIIVRSIGYAQNLQYALQSINELWPTLADLNDLIAELETQVDQWGDRGVEDVDSFELGDVSFEYEEREPALTELTLSITPGEVLGIVGPSGAGKSTLVQLLLRLRSPSSGIIAVNGHSIADYRSDDWARMLAYVPQEPRIIAATIFDNVRFFRSSITHDDAVQACRSASILDDVAALEQGFDTMLGPGGSGLSGGQRQRIALARALAGSPKILLLDEPTSALDSQSEAAIRSSIRKLAGKITVIIVTHRPAMLDICDRVIVLQDGELIGHGTRAEVEQHLGFMRDDESP